MGDKLAAATHGMNVDWAHAKIRELHAIEMFGDCVEDGQKYPCRTIQVLTVLEAASESSRKPPGLSPTEPEKSGGTS